MSNSKNRNQLRLAREHDGFLGVLASPITIANTLRAVGFLLLLVALLVAVEQINARSPIKGLLVAALVFFAGRRVLARGRQCRLIEWGACVHLEIFALLLKLSGDLSAMVLIVSSFQNKWELPISLHGLGSFQEGLEFLLALSLTLIGAGMILLVCYAFAELVMRSVPVAEKTLQD